MSDQNFNPNFNSNNEDEISLKDIVDFLFESWKTILATGIVGILGAVGYIFVTPNQYEATAQIQMAQISSNSNSNSNSSTNPLGVNVEDPNLLIARMKLPSSYSQESVKACGYESKQTPLEGLAKMVKLSLIKGTQMVELKVLGLSQIQTVQCAESIVETIKQSQKIIAAPIIEDAQLKLAKYSQRLQDAQGFILRADKSGSSMSAAYLSTRDEVKFLTDETIRLNDLITSANSRQTKLVSPIYSPENKVSPKRSIALVAGLFAGLFLGLLLMLGKRGYKAYKASN
jgi:LPS O-antigen subunit length determinant protein (WzzB/FepE family)